MTAPVHPLAAVYGVLAALPPACIGAALLLRWAGRHERIARRLREAVSGPRPREQARAGFTINDAARVVSAFGRRIADSGLLSGRALDGIQRQLSSAGIRGNGAVGLFLGSKIILMGLLPLGVATLLPESGLPPMLDKLGIATAVVVGMLLPNWLLGMAHKRYVAGVERGLPDVLDMLVMCSEAGLSLEPAILRVGTEIQEVHPAVAKELLLTAGELHILADSRVALDNLGARTGVEGLGRVARTLTQTLQYGTPLAPTLRSLTAEMRQEMLTRFEERSGRLPALLTVVMIAFILPSLFLIIGGPAMMQVFRQFGR
jgi:tight adherence protein C